MCEHGAGKGETCGATRRREIAEVPNADEAAWQDVLDEAPQKLHYGERHRARLIAVGVILPLKGDVVAIEGAQPMVADRDPMGVAPEIPEHGVRAAEQRQSILPIVTEKRLSSITRIIL